MSIRGYRPPAVIRTAVKIDEPFVNRCVYPHPGSSCTEGSGINFEIFDHVMSTLGLKYTVELAEDGDSGYSLDGTCLSLLPAPGMVLNANPDGPQNGTIRARCIPGEWHGMIGQLLRGEVVMTATLVSINDERSRVVDFSAPASFYSKSFLVHRPNAVDAAAVPTFLATPFSSTVWACFGASLVAYAFLAFFARVLLHAPGGDGTAFRHFRDSILDVARSPLGQTEPRPYSESLRLTLAYLNVPMFFLMNFYTAALTGTLMFMGRPTDPFSGFDELAPLIRDGQYTFITTGSIAKFRPPSANETDSNDEDHPDTIVRRAFSTNPPVVVQNLEQVARAIERNKSLVYWGSYNQVLDAASYSCEINVIEDRYSMPTWLAFAFRKGDPLQTIVSRALYTDTSVESFMKRMYVKYAKHRRGCPRDAEEVHEGFTGAGFFNLGLRHVQGAYFVLLYGLAVAIPAFLGEHLARKLSKRRPAAAPEEPPAAPPGIEHRREPSVTYTFGSPKMGKTPASTPVSILKNRNVTVEGVNYHDRGHRLSVGSSIGESRRTSLAVSHHESMGRRTSTVTFYLSSPNYSPK